MRPKFLHWTCPGGRVQVAISPGLVCPVSARKSPALRPCWRRPEEVERGIRNNPASTRKGCKRGQFEASFVSSPLLNLPRKTVLLIDGLGAVTSAVFLGLVLPAVQQHIGMPVATLRFLAVIAVLLAVYSLSSYRGSDPENPLWLKRIANLNLGYCALTFLLLVAHRGELKVPGWLYFLGEMLVVLGLVWVEKNHAYGSESCAQS